MNAKRESPRKGVRRVPHDPQVRDRFRGCLLGGAVGDALGAPVEFMRRSEIIKRFGEPGIRDYAPAYGKLGAITDDTQMSLFTAEGMLRAWVRSRERGIASFASVTARAYLRWLRTQGFAPPQRLPDSDNGWLIAHKELFSQRAPGRTCVSALESLGGLRAANDSKGCGGVMRAAPVGMFTSHWIGRDQTYIDKTFEVASDIAAITHGHPTGYVAAGAFAVLIAILIRGGTVSEALDATKEQVRQREHHEETLRAVELAEELSQSEPDSTEAIRKLGQGWIAEEALGIAAYCASCARDFEHGVVLAVNHDGDSDSTGAIAGNLLGCIHGLGGIPARWLEPLELRDVMVEIADDLATAPDWKLDSDSNESKFYRRRYPPG